MATTPLSSDPAAWAASVVRPYHGGLAEIDLGDCPFAYVDQAHGHAFIRALCEIFGDPDDAPVDLDTRYVPTGLLPEEPGVEPTAVIPVAAIQREYVSAEGSEGETD